MTSRSISSQISWKIYIFKVCPCHFRGILLKFDIFDNICSIKKSKSHDVENLNVNVNVADIKYKKYDRMLFNPLR